MIRFTRVLLIAAVTAALAAPALFAQSVTEPGADITLGAFKGPTAVGLVRMLEDGVKLTDGGQVEMQLVRSPEVMVSRLLTGELETAVLPVNLAAKLYNAGRPFVLAAIVGNGMLSVVSTDSGISTLSDLKGRDIYVAGQGGTPDFLMRFLLKESGIEPERDVELIFSMPPPEIAVSLIAGRIETAVLPEPFATMAVRRGSAAGKRIDLQEAWAALPGNPGSYPMTAFVVRRELAEARPVAVRELLAEYRSSLIWVEANPRAAGALVEKNDVGLPAAVAAAAIPASSYVFQPAPRARREVEQLLRTFLAFSPASIGGRLPDEQFYWE